jgi:hypothetical protein
MERFLTAYYPTAHGGIKKVQLFGYVTNSIPGIEIVGLGKSGRAIKEKLVFFTRRLNIRLPIKRFVLCLEDDSLPVGDISYLEFPLFFLLLNLADVVQLAMLENCLCSGRLMLNGGILIPRFGKLQDQKGEKLESTLLVSMQDSMSAKRSQKFIVIDELFKDRGIGVTISIGQ